MATDIQQESLCCSLANIVAEAIFFLFKTGEALLEPTARLYITNGVCYQQYNVSDDVCSQLSLYPDIENRVQTMAAHYLAYYKMILNLPALALALFCGAWSDRIGRKLPIIMSSFGTIVATVFYMASLVVMNRPTVAFLALVFTGAAVRGAFGKSTVMTMAVHSYVSDISSKLTRTQMLSKLLSMNYFGYFLGSLMTGALLQLTDFVYVFTAVIIVNALCVFITIFCMRESVPLEPLDQRHLQQQQQQEQENGIFSDELRQLTAMKSSWKSRLPFRSEHVKESLQTIIKKRENNSRAHILFLFTLIFLQQACKSGEVDITVLFTAKSPLGWSESTYGYLLAVDYACLGLASALLLPSLLRWFKVSDMTLCVVGLLFKIVRLAMLAYGRYTWLVFLSVVVGCPSALIISSAKSMISKAVSDDEIGRTFSLLSCGETIANLLGSLAFTYLYAATVSFFPGLAFAADAGLMVLLLIAFLFLRYDLKRFKDTPYCPLKPATTALLPAVDEFECTTASQSSSGDVIDSQPVSNYGSMIQMTKSSPVGEYNQTIDITTESADHTVRGNMQSINHEVKSVKSPDEKILCLVTK